MAGYSQKVAEPKLSDSGYASAASTPEKGDESNNRDASQVSSQTTPLSHSRTSPIGSLKGLKIFDKDVGQEVWDRFKDVVERVEGPLIEYLRKRYRAYRPMAIRLMVLGENYLEAKPRLVVLCLEKIAKRVKKFFEKSMIKSICSPDDPSQTPFDVTVIGQPPRSRNANAITEVYGALMDQASEERVSSSTLIRLSTEQGDQYATMGGLIKIVQADGSFSLCGLTAGHILGDCDTATLGESDQWRMEDTSDSEISSDEESSSDEDMLDADSLIRHSEFREGSTTSELHGSKTSWSRVGTISVHPRPAEGLDRDWALITDVDKLFQQPNVIKNGGTRRVLHMLPEARDRATPVKSANKVLVVKSGLPQKGFVSRLPTMALLPSGRKFVQVYTLSLDDNTVLPAGSSGSWVVNERSCEVYGHVVADDPFGDVFVVPLSDVLNDIKQAVDAVAVTLASQLDIFSLTQTTTILTRAKNYEPESEHPSVPTSSKNSFSRSEEDVPKNIASHPFQAFIEQKQNQDSARLASPLPSVPHNLPDPRSKQEKDCPKPPPPISLIPRDPPSNPMASPVAFADYVASYVRQSSPLATLLQPFGGHLSPPSRTESLVLRSQHAAPWSPFNQRPQHAAPLSAVNTSFFDNPTFLPVSCSSVNNPSECNSSMLFGTSSDMDSGYGSSIPNSCQTTPQDSDLLGNNELFKCDKCSGRFSSKDELSRHKRTHQSRVLFEDAESRPFKCDQCPQSFNRNHDLKRHKRIHLAIKPFPCEHCEKSFSRKDALKRHVLVKGCGKAATSDSAEGSEFQKEQPSNDMKGKGKDPTTVS
jgi:hypothetical protein